MGLLCPTFTTTPPALHCTSFHLPAKRTRHLGAVIWHCSEVAAVAYISLALCQGLQLAGDSPGPGDPTLPTV